MSYRRIAEDLVVAVLGVIVGYTGDESQNTVVLEEQGVVTGQIVLQVTDELGLCQGDTGNESVTGVGAIQEVDCTLCVYTIYNGSNLGRSRTNGVYNWTEVDEVTQIYGVLVLGLTVDGVLRNNTGRPVGWDVLVTDRVITGV